MSIGIDYGAGQTNIDLKNGIRYGIIASNRVGQYWYDESEMVYLPYCHKCGNKIDETQPIPDTVDIDGDDYWCAHCQKIVRHDYAFGEFPDSIEFDDGKYKAFEDDSGDIFIVKSPYYTLCAFCSPCAPGAGDICAPRENGIKAYCFAHDWFEEGKAPYKVFDVKTGKEVLADRKDDCQNCKKCGTTICGADTTQFSCFESKI